MTAAERDQLVDLYLTCRDLTGEAGANPRHWPAAPAADAAFFAALNAIEVTA